ncbi:hypothetical protein DFA_08133 [Cavenderia fasciculata]|uniref:RNA helicase n=1 Tax=Cavenderia fasciculata TaxID=261658 RepID=F4Q592_CACFS|nr:uncharacterized protein DFA_08133 [Cavenderia fasciculata]EGG17151.1 hypothetical protein DFA_08133 [Cavenderia fasciculata]|eukprot:XP_004355635.1 hypothetical protein DFA_08133 [Cavenderia fasciculata]
MFSLLKSSVFSVTTSNTTTAAAVVISTTSSRFFGSSSFMLNRFNNNYNNNNNNRSFNNYNNNNNQNQSSFGYQQQQQQQTRAPRDGVKFSFGQKQQQQQQDDDSEPMNMGFIERSGGSNKMMGNGGGDAQNPLAPVDWSLEQLPAIEPVDYVPSENTASMTPADRDAYFKDNNIFVTSRDQSAVPNPITEFDDSPFPAQIKSILNTNFEKPSVIQTIGWPSSLAGRDLLGISQTGSGKTLSFGIPAIMHILAQKQVKYFGPQVLVVAPTRELSVQIAQEMAPYLKACGLKFATLYGGDPKIKQIEQMRYKPQFVVGTPGRILDLANDGYLSLKRTSYVVLDEADRMLEMGFEDQIRQIFSNVRPDHQLLYWTATWPKKVEALANEFIKTPIRVQVGNGELSANPNITQNFTICETEADKTSKLIDVLEGIFTERPTAKVLIFTMTKGGADKLADYIRSNGNARIDSIHGDKQQSRRIAIINAFKRDQLDILVATDVASRGLDIRTITDVINFSMPNQSESYVHRIGRTARAGASGYSHSLISKTSSNDIELIPDVIDLLERANQPIPEDLKALAPRKQQNNSYNNRGFGGNRGYNNNRGGGRGGYNNNRGGSRGGYNNNNNGGGSRFGGQRSGPISFGGN